MFISEFLVEKNCFYSLIGVDIFCRIINNTSKSLQNNSFVPTHSHQTLKMMQVNPPVLSTYLNIVYINNQRL